MKTLFRGGKVWLGKGQLTHALLIEDGRILEVGNSALSADEVIELNGSFLMPAFSDGHAHPLFAGREAQGPKVNGLQTVAEIVAEVRRFAEANPNVKWIVGGA